jgi:hypothetical protein
MGLTFGKTFGCMFVLCVIRMNVIQLNVIMLNVIKLRVSMLNVVAPFLQLLCLSLFSMGLYYKTFYSRNLQILVNNLGKAFQPSLMFVGEARKARVEYPKGASLG